MSLTNRRLLQLSGSYVLIGPFGLLGIASRTQRIFIAPAYRSPLLERAGGLTEEVSSIPVARLHADCTEPCYVPSRKSGQAFSPPKWRAWARSFGSLACSRNARHGWSMRHIYSVRVSCAYASLFGIFVWQLWEACRRTSVSVSMGASSAVHYCTFRDDHT